MIGNRKTARNQSQRDAESHWQANCRDQLSLLAGADRFNTKAVGSDLWKIQERRQLFYGLTFATYLHTHEHTHVHVCMCTHIYT